ncbi:MAG: M20/M25/M40 family metallo-hydrolase, partial [Anaerolineae bacterium]|nr:M20/M25/M40 family metallo-hydrolase [Anaerolineae bacterium]
GARPPVLGAPFACDLFALHAAGVPAVVFGPAGSNYHTPDEYVDLESMTTAAQALVRLVVDWCGVV